MNIEKTDESTYLIELSSKEMQNYKITYNPNGIYSKKIEKTFTNILKEHTKAFSFSQICVDILPGIPTGCVAIIKEKNENDLYSLFETDDINFFIDCAKALKSKKAKANSSLYKNESVYRIIIESSDFCINSILSEFSDKVAFQKSEILYTKNEMDCIIENNALEILSGNGFKA